MVELALSWGLFGFVGFFVVLELSALLEFSVLVGLLAYSLYWNCLGYIP